MASLPFRFRKFLEGVRPSSSERRALRRAHLWVRRVISKSSELRPYVVSVFLQGSYRRATAIGAREGRPSSDVDLVVVTKLDRKAHSPEGALRMVAPILQREGVVVRTQGRSLRIDHRGASLDLVVTSAPSQTELELLSSESSADALDDDDERPSEAERQAWRLEPLWIPDREAKRWRPTHPLAQLAKTREKNQATGGHYVNVVKVTRAWALRAGLEIKGYPLERLVEATCPDDIESVAEGFTRTLEALAADYRGSSKPKLAGHGVRGQDVLARVSEEDWGRLIACAREASVVARKALEEPDEGASAAAWAGLLGSGFPTGAVVAAPPVAEPTRETWLRRLEQRGRLVARGLDQLHELKRALRRVVETLGLRIVWDPSSPPELRDVIGVAALAAARGALIGGSVGLLLGSLTREPKTFMWVGAAVGAVWGGIRGFKRVRKGWRIRCWYDAQGEPCAELLPIE